MTHDIQVTMDLPRLGELIAAVVQKFAEMRDLDPPDYAGEEMREVSRAGWRQIEFMIDRVQFEKAVKSDIAAIPTLPHKQPPGSMIFPPV